jgi:heme/copper-type cytochrome/quinol oxidase subunit 2
VLQAKAQCAMCRAVLESGEDQSAAEGINDGIMFLMVVPYILVAVIGFYVYRTFSKSKRVKKIDN